MLSTVGHVGSSGTAEIPFGFLPTHLSLGKGHVSPQLSVVASDLA